MKKRYPSISSMNGRTLGRLLAGKRITHRDLQGEVASYRLAHYVYCLRRDGWAVHDEWEENATSDPTTRRARYKRYWLHRPDIQAAGEQGQQYAAKVRQWEAKRQGAA